MLKSVRDDEMILTDVIGRLSEFTDDAVLISEAEPIDQPGPRVVWCNEAFTRMTGFAAEEIVGNTPRILQGPDTSAEVKARISARLKAWQPVREQIKNYRRDGTPFWVDLGIRPVADDAGWYHYWVAIQRDITQQKETEFALHHAQKLEAIGQLSSGVAHDFNNILTSIISSVEVLERVRCDDARFVPLVDRIKAAAERGAGVTRQLVNAARPAPSGEVKVLVHDEILRATGLFATSGHEIRTAFAKCDPVVRVDPGLLSSALLNLIKNARDAMPTGGIISLRTEVHEDHTMSIAIADTGMGMSIEEQKNVFAPFFTTKGERGTGLGLSMVRRFADQAGGSVKFKSEPGLGATFTLTLPLEELRLRRDEALEGVGVLERGFDAPLHVLIMENDPAVADAVDTVLKDEGFVAIRSINGEELERAIAAREIAVALIDPAAIDPPAALVTSQIPIVLMTSALPGVSEYPILEKPFNAAALLRAVRRAVGMPAPQPSLFEP